MNSRSLHSPAPFVSVPSGAKKLELWEVPKSPRPNPLAFQTEWKEVVSSSEESMVERTSGHHVPQSSLTGSDFEFDLGAVASDVEDPPVSPKLTYSQTAMPPMFMYSDLWTDGRVYTRQVPVLAPIPRRSALPISVRQLLAADMKEDASSCVSHPPSPRSQRLDKQIANRGAGQTVGDAEEIKSPGLKIEKKSKSSPDMSIFHHSCRTRRVHHAEEDAYPSSRFSDSPLSTPGSPWRVDESSNNHDSASQTHHRKRRTLKDLLRSSRRSSHDQSKATKTQEFLGSHTSKSTAESSRPKSPRTTPRPMSPHEAHYKNQKAQWDEMKKKTSLPIRQGLLGCLGGPVFSVMPEYRAVM